jgi:hypothetical protein
MPRCVLPGAERFGPGAPERPIVQLPDALRNHIPQFYDIVGRGRIPGVVYRDNVIQLVYGRP